MDQEFVQVMLQIEESYQDMNKHQKIRVEAWTKKLCQVTTNDVWKRNRNLYAKILLQQVTKMNLTEPFDKRPPEGPLPKLNRYLIHEQTRPVHTAVSPQVQSPQRPAPPIKYEEMHEKLLKLLIDYRAYLETKNDPEAIQLKRQQDEVFSYLSGTNPQSDTDTMQFLQYLDNFEKKTERLKQESENYLHLFAVSLLVIGIFEQGVFFPFDWLWVYYFGKIFALPFIREEHTQEERNALLQKEETAQAYIPFMKYVYFALWDLLNALLICLQLVYMSFGLFILCQSVQFVSYIVYRQNKNQFHYIYAIALLFAGIFSLANDAAGNSLCYVGLIAVVIQIGSFIYSSAYQESFMESYIITHPKLTAFSGLVQFVIWGMILVIVQFIPCHLDGTDGNIKCPSHNLEQTQTFFSETFGSGYAIAVFVVFLFLGPALQYLDNKLILEKQIKNKLIVMQMTFLPVQLWILLTSTNDRIAFSIISMLCFLIQWAIGIKLILTGEDVTYIPLEQEESELS